MGHCKMLLAVAGLDEASVNSRIKRLAVGDWSEFTAAEQAALIFARKAARPSGVSREDFRRLCDHFGPDGAVDVLWWVCRAHYLTRVADAFQLPLESTNVFDGFAPQAGS
jgi:hypothetical protein